MVPLARNLGVAGFSQSVVAGMLVDIDPVSEFRYRKDGPYPIRRRQS